MSFSQRIPLVKVWTFGIASLVMLHNEIGSAGDQVALGVSAGQINIPDLRLSTRSDHSFSLQVHLFGRDATNPQRRKLARWICTCHDDATAVLLANGSLPSLIHSRDVLYSLNDDGQWKWRSSNPWALCFDGLHLTGEFFDPSALAPGEVQFVEINLGSLIDFVKSFGEVQETWDSVTQTLRLHNDTLSLAIRQRVPSDIERYGCWIESAEISFPSGAIAFTSVAIDRPDEYPHRLGPANVVSQLNAQESNQPPSLLSEFDAEAVVAANKAWNELFAHQVPAAMGKQVAAFRERTIPSGAQFIATAPDMASRRGMLKPFLRVFLDQSRQIPLISASDPDRGHSFDPFMRRQAVERTLPPFDLTTIHISVIGPLLDCSAIGLSEKIELVDTAANLGDPWLPFLHELHDDNLQWPMFKAIYYSRWRRPTTMDHRTSLLNVLEDGSLSAGSREVVIESLIRIGAIDGLPDTLPTQWLTSNTNPRELKRRVSSALMTESGRDWFISAVEAGEFSEESADACLDVLSSLVESTVATKAFTMISESDCAMLTERIRRLKHATPE